MYAWTAPAFTRNGLGANDPGLSSLMDQFEQDYPDLCEVVEIGTLESGRKLIMVHINDSLGTDLPLLLDAGADYVSYIWNGVPGTQTYNATEYIWYTLVVTDSNACVGSAPDQSAES